MSRGSKQFYFRYMNRRKAYEKKMYSSYHNVISSVFNKVVSSLESGNKTIPSVDIMKRDLLNKTRPAYRALITGAVEYTVKDVEEKLGGKIPLTKALTEEQASRFGLPNTLAVIEKQTMYKVATIARNLHDSLRGQFQLSTDAGESVAQLATRIKAIADPYPKSFARRIAQTETTRAWNVSTLETYKTSEVVSMKEWVGGLSGNPRESHLEANGQQVPVDEPFRVGDAELMEPGDPSGPPEETVNCHCGMMPVINMK